MKKQWTFSQKIAGLAVVTALLLLVLFTAMQATNEVNWSLVDFLIMGMLLFGIGLSYLLLTRGAPNIAYRAAAGLALVTTFLMIWANLAVGLIGSGPNPGNLMYMGVILVVIIGSIRSQFRSAGMERAMYAAILALAALSVIAFIMKMHRYPDSSVTEILAVNGFFAGLFAVAGSLFHYAAKKTLSKHA